MQLHLFLHLGSLCLFNLSNEPITHSIVFDLIKKGGQLVVKLNQGSTDQLPITSNMRNFDADPPLYYVRSYIVMMKNHIHKISISKLLNSNLNLLPLFHIIFKI